MQFTASHAISEQCVGVGEALARAFHDDPVFSYMLGRNDFPNSKAQRFFRTFYNLQLSQELSYTAHDDAGKCLGASIWCAPDAWKVRLRDIARIAPTLTTVFGAGLPRALIALQRLEHLHPKEPHYYLEFIGTDPDAQGNGVGSALLAPMLERCDQEQMPAYLESSKESNVAFYARHGFSVSHVMQHPGGPQQWLMWREPRGLEHRRDSSI